MRKIFLYAIFAFVATAINLLLQWPFFHFFRGAWVLFAALAAGTLAGLAVKYFLDRRWIFCFKPASRQDGACRFILYSLMGVATTAIFWSTEILFFHMFSFPGSQYAGGAVGLAAGYTSKYFLDKRFVFRTDACNFQDGAATR